MKELDFFDAMTQIDDAYVLEAHESAAHRSPARFGGFRRAAVLIAAVMMMVATVVAAGGDFITISPRVRYNSDSYWYEMVHSEQSDTINVNGTEHTYLVYTTLSPERAVASMRFDSGETLEVIFEVDIRMDDGTIKHKCETKQGTQRVVAFLSNEVDGEKGIILQARTCFIRITEDGTKETVANWRESMSPMFFEDETQCPTAEAILPEGSDVVVVIPDSDE